MNRIVRSVSGASRKWIKAIEASVAMNQREYDRMLKGTRQYAGQFTAQDSARQHAEMLKSALAS